MSLDALSTELLLLVFEYVGVEHFRARTGCLTVSKRWYSVAQLVLFRDVRLSPRTLYKFPPQSPRVCELLKSHLVRLEIQLQGYRDEQDVLTFRSRNVRFSKWKIRLNGRLYTISTFISQCHGLKSFHFHTSFGWDDNFWDHITRGAYLMLSPTRDLISAASSSLTELVIDTVSVSLDGKGHICPTIARQIPTLRRLYLYMTAICLAILTLPQNTDKCILEDLTIRLSQQDPETTKTRFSSACDREALSKPSLRDAIIKAATERECSLYAQH